jgi:hypothetical protein
MGHLAGGAPPFALRITAVRKLAVEAAVGPPRAPYSPDQKMAAGCILNRTQDSKMELPGSWE